MSEVTRAPENGPNLRWRFLATASAAALLSVVSTAEALAADDDADRSPLWIELGGQLSRLDDGQEVFAPAFPVPRSSSFSPSSPFERPPLYSIDGTGKLSFESENSDWVFSASIRYGRAASQKNVHQQTYPKSFVVQDGTQSGKPYNIKYNPPLANRFADTSVRNDESHAVVDFQVGKDVGLGLFGRGSAQLNLGVRYAQFSSKSSITLKSNPDWKFVYKYIGPGSSIKVVKSQPYHSNFASLYATRSFHGIGPSLSWSGSSPFMGNTKDGELSFDWGANAAILFGRQKARTHHQTTARHGIGTRYNDAYRSITFQGPASPDHARVRTVIVPNVGGFAGLSFQIQNFKVSAGYRADFFFNAMDGGIDTRKSENVGFYGPFATVSIGIGG